MAGAGAGGRDASRNDAPAVAEKEHGEALVMVDPFADLFALVEDRPGDTLDRPREGSFIEPVNRAVERGIPGTAEGDRARPRTETVGVDIAHADGLARIADAAACGQRRQEGGSPSAIQPS